MRSSSLSRALISASLLSAALATPAHAQKAWEWVGLGIVTVADSNFYGGGLGFGYRTNGRMRVQFLLA